MKLRYNPETGCLVDEEGDFVAEMARGLDMEGHEIARRYNNLDDMLIKSAIEALFDLKRYGFLSAIPLEKAIAAAQVQSEQAS